MVIVKLEVAHFGKLKNRNITLRPGMNVITGENESGKSTIAAFIKSMIYGAQNSPEIRRYEPYEDDGVFGGKMRILVSGAFYTVERSFVKGKESLQVVKESDDSVVADPEGFLKEAMSGLTAEEYGKTGCAAQNFFLQDIQRLRETPEKREALEREKAVLGELHRAKEKLQKEYDEKTEKLKTAESGEAQRIRAELGENANEVARLNAEYPEVVEQLRTMEEAYQRDLRRRSEDRQKTEEALRADMLERKQELEKHTKEAGGKIRKNTPGIILMTLAFLLVFAAYFFMCSNKIDRSSAELFYGVIGAFALGFALFAAGFIMTVVRVSRNKRILKETEMTELFRKRADDAEQRYQSFMHDKDGKIGSVLPDEEREEKIRELSRKADELHEELEMCSRKQEELSEISRQIDTEFCGRDKISAELEVIKTALEAFEDTEAGEKEDEAFKTAASEYLSRLDPRKASTVRADGGFITVDDGVTALPLEQLSLSGAVEVLLASRLAWLDRKDTKKVVPVVLDDVLAGLDSDRVNSNMAVLRSLGRQVILLSCQQRERRAL